VCGARLDESDPAALACTGHEATYTREHGVYDLRLHRSLPGEPAPIRRRDFDAPFAAQDAGAPFIETYEELLRSLDVIPSDRLMQILGEGSATWLTTLESSRGDLLFLGNALSGSVPALSMAGFDVTVLDVSPERLRFGQWRNASRAEERVRSIVGGQTRWLPFADKAFAVVAVDRGFPGALPKFGWDPDECARVCAGELVLVGNNRLGYKRSTGRRSIHYVPNPISWAAAAIAPREGERTLLGHRRALSAPGFERSRAFALYPHATDFTHVVALDAELPSLTIGPKERRNKLKLSAVRLGLFPVLAPSFLLVGKRAGSTAAMPTRIDRILHEIAEAIGEPIPEVEHLVATRGQSVVVHTRSKRGGADERTGRWTLHIPLSQWNLERAPRRNPTLESLRKRFPSVPMPEPLFSGIAGGMMLTCERRLGGLTAPQHSGDRGIATKILAESSEHFARLLVRPAAPFTSADFDELLAPKFEVVARKAGVASTVANLARMRDALRARLLGRSIPRVYYHSDLRDKHVQVGDDGSVLAYLDWSVSEPEFLPYQDVLNLVVHGRKQEGNVPIGEAWRIARDRSGLLAHEREPLERYAALVGIDDEVRRAIEAAYPVFVAAMAERTWGYTRPRWLHRQFGI
jgi:hypothetical protein